MILHLLLHLSLNNLKDIFRHLKELPRDKCENLKCQNTKIFSPADIVRDICYKYQRWPCSRSFLFVCTQSDELGDQPTLTHLCSLCDFVTLTHLCSQSAFLSPRRVKGFVQNATNCFYLKCTAKTGDSSRRLACKILKKYKSMWKTALQLETIQKVPCRNVILFSNFLFTI